MKLFLFFVCATLIVFFYIYLSFGNLANAVIGGLLVACLYIFLLPLVTKMDFLTRGQNGAIIVASWILIAGCMLANLQMYRTTNWQKKTLLTIRSSIGEGILQDNLTKKASSLLDVFTKQTTGKNISLAATASQLFPFTNEKKKLIETVYDGEDSTKKVTGGVYLYSSSPDSVFLIGVDTIAYGINPDFKNFAGNQGKVQVKMGVSTKGLSYKAEN